jgi:hypothetical protein
MIRVIRKKTIPDLISHGGKGVKNKARRKIISTVRQSKTRSTRIVPTAAVIWI